MDDSPLIDKIPQEALSDIIRNIMISCFIERGRIEKNKKMSA